MAKPKHIEILKKGIAEWNEYRSSRRSTKCPVFIKADLNGADLQFALFAGANFEGANLAEANLNNADLAKAKLFRADLIRAKLKMAKLDGANLKFAILVGANLESTKLIGANLTEAKLIGTNLAGANLAQAKLVRTNLESADLVGAELPLADLTEANLAMANLSWANLDQAKLNMANLVGANLEGVSLLGTSLSSTVFNSKSQLKNLAHPLTDAQIANARFLDEEDKHKKRAKDGQKKGKEPILFITFNGDLYLSPLYLGALLTSIQITYNRLLFLVITEDDDLDRIKKQLAGPCYASPEDEIFVDSIQKGSVEVILKYIDANSSPRARKAFVAMVSVVILGWQSLESYKTFQEAEKLKAETEKIELEKKKLQKELNIPESETNHDWHHVPNSLILIGDEYEIGSDEIKQHFDFSRITVENCFENPVVKTNHEDLTLLAFDPMMKVMTKLSYLGLDGVSAEVQNIEEHKIV